MARLIGSSIDGIVGCELSLTWVGKLKIALPYGWKSRTYTQEQIVAVTPIEEDKYRSAGGAAVGAILGGVLTGGIGLLAGAAYGGRRRHRNSYLVVFDDGNHVAFEEAKKATIKSLNQLVQSAKVKSLISDREELISTENAILVGRVTVTEASPTVNMIGAEQLSLPQVAISPSDQPKKIVTSKLWLKFLGLAALVFGVTFYSSLENGIGMSFFIAFSAVLPLFLMALVLMMLGRIYRWFIRG